MILLFVLDLDVLPLSDVSVSHLSVVDIVLVVKDIVDNDVVVLVVSDVEDDDVVVVIDVVNDIVAVVIDVVNDVVAVNDVKHDVLQLPFLRVADDRCGIISESPTQPGDGKIDEKELYQNRLTRIDVQKGLEDYSASLC